MRVLHRLRRALTTPDEDHVLYVFTPQVDKSVHVYERFGYLHAWNNRLLGVEVARAGAPLVSRYFDVREFTVADLAAYESIGGPSSVARTLSDPNIHTFLSYDTDGEPVGRAQLVTCVDGIAYVSAMYTVPTCRRRGVGTGLLHAMHTRARREGATHCILVPSQEATEFGFYPRFGYRTVAHHAVFVPDRDMDESTSYER